MHFVAAISKLTGQHNDLRNHQFGNRSRIREGGVEDDDACTSCILEVNLIGADAEAPDDNEVLCVSEHLFRELRLGPDSNDVDIPVSN